MMELLEARRLSALFCGHGKDMQVNGHEGQTRIFIFLESENRWAEWSPDTNAEQMAECMQKVIDAGWVLCFDPRKNRPHQIWSIIDGVSTISYFCPWREFPMRAAAELQRRKG